MNPENQNNPNASPVGATEPAAPMQATPTTGSINPLPVGSMTAAPAPAQKKTGKLIAIIVIVILILAGAGYGAYAMLGKDDKKTDSTTTTQTTNISETNTTTGSSSATDTTTPASTDSARKSALSALQTDLETYYGNYVYYPTVAQLTSSSFQKSNLTAFNKSLASSKLTLTIGSAIAENVIAYKPTPSSCNNSATDCMSYEISVQLSTKQSDGTYVYTKKALN